MNEYNYNKIAGLIKDKERIFYLESGVDYYLCEEGSLKLKEMSYIHCEAFETE